MRREEGDGRKEGHSKSGGGVRWYLLFTVLYFQNTIPRTAGIPHPFGPMS